MDEQHGSRYWKASESDYKSFSQETGAIHLHLGISFYGIGMFENAKDNISKGLKLLGMSVPSKSTTTLFSVASWAVSNIALAKKQKPNWKKWEKRFGWSESLENLIKDISKAYGALAQTYVLTNAPTIMFLSAISQMHSIACSVDDSAGICHACAWLTTVLVISGKPAAAARFSKQASDLADQNPTDNFIAPTSYAKMWSYGGAGRLREAVHEANKAKESFLAIGDLRRYRETQGMLSAFLGSLGRFEKAIQCAEETLADASKTGDKELEANGYILKGDNSIFKGMSTAIEITERGYSLYRTILESEGVDLSQKNFSSGTVSIAYCMQGDFQKAANAIMDHCNGGMRTRQYIWHNQDVVTCAVALWEIDNHIRGNRAIDGLDLIVFGDAREMLKKRAKNLAKLFAMAKSCDAFKTFFSGFSEFQELETLELDMFSAQQTEIVMQVSIAKFYWVLAKCTYEERESQGITLKRKGKKSSIAKVGALNVTGSSGGASSGREGENLKVVALDGENLKMMKKAIDGLKEIEMGLFSNQSEKTVAIDDGNNVIFRWGDGVAGGA